MSNSPLVTCTLLSPNCTKPRSHAIDTVSIHCFVAQVTAERGCQVFQPRQKQASANYVVGYDGSIGLCVEERDRSWCTSSAANDHRAITIEVASDATHPYAVTDKAMEALLELLVDICRRNGKKKLLWIGDKAKTLAYTPAADEMVMTVHRWFASKACPGEYLYSRHGEIAAEVNRRLDAAEKKEDDTMDKQTFETLMDQWQKDHAAPAPDSTPSDWAKVGVDWAVGNGLMEGDGNGDLMLHHALTREQFCVMLKRYHEKREKLV